MDSSYSIVRRFTPPTCTLEIWGKNSPLSLWTKQPIIKDVHFKLSFDDPKNLDAEPITILGDRVRLEQIYCVVLSYAENFLEQSFTNQVPALALSNQNQSVNSEEPHLTFQGLVNHQFNLGDLTKLENPSTILLSATQLFDLVSALEEYKTEMAVLAKLEAKQAQKSRKMIPLGLRVAGILLAVGLTTVGIKVAHQPEKQEQIAATQESQGQAPPTTPLEDVIPPEVPEIVNKPTEKLKESEPLSSTETLPPPPAVDTPKPPPNIPDPAKYPPSGNLTIPPLSSLPPKNPVSETAKSNTETQPDNSQVESTIAVSPETVPSETQTNTESNSQITTSPSVTENDTLKPSENRKQAEIPINQENTVRSSEIENPSEQAASLSNRAASNSVTENETEENLARNNNNSDIALNNANPKPTPGESAIRENEPEAKVAETQKLQEVASYFQQKWRSPAELKQTLEYRLILQQNGTIKRIIPLGKASEIYLDRTNIPLMGEPFVSPLQNEQTVTIRLLLSPDGEVRTFLE